MTKVTISFETDNDAFRTEEGMVDVDAVKSFLHDEVIVRTADAVNFYNSTGDNANCSFLREINGNTVGKVCIDE